jgi:hypothetical protein
MEFLSHPLLIAVVSILLGSGLIDKINKRKEKREFVRNEAIKLIEEISDLLNDDLTWLFSQVRLQSFKIEEGFAVASRNTFSKRLKIKVKTKTYLKEEDILKDYDIIIKEISFLKQHIFNSNKESFDDEKVQLHINELKAKWHINNNYPIEILEYPFNHYFSWSQVIWYRTENYISTLLNKANSI